MVLLPGLHSPLARTAFLDRRHGSSKEIPGLFGKPFGTVCQVCAKETPRRVTYQPWAYGGTDSPPLSTGNRWKKRRPGAFLVHEFFKVDVLFRPSKLCSERRDEAIPLIRRANLHEPEFCRDIDNDFFFPCRISRQTLSFMPILNASNSFVSIQGFSP